MARQKEDRTRLLAGKIGQMIFYEVDGQQRVRSRAKAPMAIKSLALKESQSDFARLMKVMQAVVPFVRIGFSAETGGKMMFHKALGYNLQCYRNAQDKTFLRWLVLSVGQRAGAESFTAQLQGHESLLIAWGQSQAQLPHAADDLVMLLAINPCTLEAIFQYAVCKRGDHSATLKLPPVQAGDTVQLFICFFQPMPSVSLLNPKSISSSQRLEIQVT